VYKLYTTYFLSYVQIALKSSPKFTIHNFTLSLPVGYTIPGTRTYTTIANRVFLRTRVPYSTFINDVFNVVAIFAASKFDSVSFVERYLYDYYNRYLYSG
jgi:hypothetical protein